MATTLPSRAQAVASRNPDVWAAYEKLGQACAKAGPLDARTRRLIKIALAIGHGSEGALHSHVRQALADGLNDAELRHVGLLAITTLGLPSAVAALTWMEDVLAKGAKRRKPLAKRSLR